MSVRKIEIIIADDHTIFLEGLTALLQSLDEISIVGAVANGQEVLNILKVKHADVVITDIDMPVMDGMKLAKEIKKNHPQVKVLALTMHNEGRIISSILKAGVAGYVLKDTGKQELLSAITDVWSGKNYFSDDVKTKLAESMMPGKKSLSSSFLIELSERETEILKLIAAEFTQSQIAEKLFISEHTVIFHKRKLFVKFNVKNTAGLIKSGFDLGFLE